MNNKIKIAIEVIAIVAVILIIFNIIKNVSSSNENLSDTEIATSDILYNETSGEYYIEDEETGEVLHTGESEEELYIYTIDSDYEAWDPDETDNTIE